MSFQKQSHTLPPTGMVSRHIPTLGRGRYDWMRRNSEVRRDGFERLENLRGKHTDQPAFILGNGPSIRSTDFGLLRGKVTIAVNSTFRLYPEIGWVSPYTCFSDRIRWLESGENALRLSPGSQFIYSDDWEVPTPHTLFKRDELDRVILVDQYYKLPRILQKITCIKNRVGMYTYHCLMKRHVSFDLKNGACLGNSVIFLATQLAVHLGCNPVVLLGVDMDYSQKSKHFHNENVWTPPMDYERDAKPWFLLFRDELGSKGIEFLNATNGGRVDCLKRIDYRQVARLGSK